MALSANKFLLGCLRVNNASCLNVVQVRTHMGYIPHEGRFGPDHNSHGMMFKNQRRLVNLQVGKLNNWHGLLYLDRTPPKECPGGVRSMMGNVVQDNCLEVYNYLTVDDC